MTPNGHPLSIGIVGTRHVHTVMLARCLEALGCSIVGAAESDPAAAREWATHDLGAVLDREELFDRCDAVVIAGTNSERVDDTIAAVDAGLPTLAEKPIACSGESLARIARHDRAHELTMLALPLRFARVSTRAKDAIEAGHLGTPVAGRCTNHGMYPGGWFGDPGLAGGGAVMDHTVHVSDGLCWMLGDTVTDVYCETGTFLHDLAVDDCGIVTLGFASGFFASLDASWSRPPSFHTWGDVWIELVGTAGRLVIDPLATNVRLYDDAAGKLRTLDYGDDMAWSMCAAFVAFARGHAPPSVTLAEGIHASAVVLAAYRSAGTHRVEAVVSPHA